VKNLNYKNSIELLDLSIALWLFDLQSAHWPYHYRYQCSCSQSEIINALHVVTYGESELSRRATVIINLFNANVNAVPLMSNQKYEHSMLVCFFYVKCLGFNALLNTCCDFSYSYMFCHLCVQYNNDYFFSDVTWRKHYKCAKVSNFVMHYEAENQ